MLLHIVINQLIAQLNWDDIDSLIIIITVINLLIPNKFIDEAHSVFISKKDISTISNFLPPSIISDIYKNYSKSFDVETLLKSGAILGNFNSSKEDLDQYSSIKSSFAFSSDNFFYRSNYSRKVNSFKRYFLRVYEGPPSYY